MWPFGAALAGVTLLAGLLRLMDLSLVEFKYDEARVAGLTDLLVHNGQLPATSIVTSAGVQNSPIVVYLLAPAAFISWRPEVLTGFVAILNVIAVVLTALMVQRFWGPRAGILCGLLYAVAPLAIHYSRKIWAPEMMPWLSVICLWSLLLVFERGRPWFLVTAAAACSALVQLHQAAVWLLPGMLLVAAFNWRRLRPLPVLTAVVISLVVATPYANYEYTHQWADLRALLALAGKTANLSAIPWWYTWALGSGWGLPSFLGPPEQVLQPDSTSRSWLDIAGLVLFSAGLVQLISSFRRNRHQTDRGDEDVHRAPSGRMAALIVLLWTFLPPLGLTRTALPVFPHYLIYWYPAPFIVAALGLDGVWTWLGSRLSTQSARAGFRVDHVAVGALVALL